MISSRFRRVIADKKDRVTTESPQQEAMAAASPYIASVMTPPQGSRAESLASAYTYRENKNMVSQPMKGTVIGRGLSSLTEKLSRLDIKKVDRAPPVRF